MVGVVGVLVVLGVVGGEVGDLGVGDGVGGVFGDVAEAVLVVGGALVADDGVDVGVGVAEVVPDWS